MFDTKMDTRMRTRVQAKKPQRAHENVEMRGSLAQGKKRASKDGKTLSRDRKLALQQDVERLKKMLRNEENIHRALERAFNRPLGALPRLPPYLPPNTLGLVAEVAVLEEEIARLEEQVVHFRQDLYQEAMHVSSTKMKLDHSARLNNASPSNDSPWLSKTEDNAGAASRPTLTVHEDRQGKENQSYICSYKSTKQSHCNGQTARTPIKKLTIDHNSLQKRWDPPKEQACDFVQQEQRLNDQPVAEVTDHSSIEKPPGDESPNIISENILKCLSSILSMKSTARNPGSAGDKPPLWDLKSQNCVEGAGFPDPYGICLEFSKRDIGPYKQLLAIDGESFNRKRMAKSLFLLHRLKVLLRKLASVNLVNLNHQGKLAFWINIYNSCMMNAFVENSIPESPETIVELMQKATINVGGNFLSATTIEHCILRLPYHWKFTLPKGVKNHEMTVRSIYGLELSEPLVTFALSCGTWSSPAMRVYTASQVENELEEAKRERSEFQRQNFLSRSCCIGTCWTLQKD